MKTTSLVLLTIGLAAGASVATTYLLRPDAAPVMQDTAAAPEELLALREQVAQLSEDISRLRSEASAAALPQAGGAERVDLEEIDRAVARYFDQRLSGVAESDLARAAEAAAPVAESVSDVSELLSQLANASLTEGEREEVWARIREAGLLDDAIALLEAKAEKFSDDPDVQLEVASAYIQKIFDVGEGPQAGIWAGKADKAYDRALAIDEQHWKARFNKAISLSFWPPIYGKQAEAISHFETLVTQQDGQQSEQRFVQTYVLLGNLYTQTGELEKAKAIWNKGLALFPTDASLLAKLGE
jgi:tetratricopeptide (TPR) repeat protein